MLIFRTDASATTGFGHLKRSHYLASLLKHRQDICFCVNSDKVVSRFLEDRGTPFCLLKNINSLKSKEIKGIIFDLREFSPSDINFLHWAREKHQPPITTIQVTDLGLSRQAVDYTVDAGIDCLHPYESTENLLMGPEVVPLHNSYRHFNKVRRKYRKRVRNVFITLGGAVQYRRLRRLVDLLNRQQVNIKVAPGFYMRKSSIKALKRLYPRLGWVGRTETLARSFFEADVALVTSGVAAAEAAAVGTPCLYFYYHDEQKFIAQAYEKKGAGLVISHIDDLLSKKETIVEALRILTLEKRTEIGERGKQLVDGKGVYRIMAFFEEIGLL